jgi:heme/copper-type cytochrome/quinol oxidase subunit 1
MKTKWVPWVLGALLLAASFLVEGAAFDIQLYDTYYVVGWASLLKGLGLVCFIAGGARLLRKRYSSQQS